MCMCTTSRSFSVRQSGGNTPTAHSIYSLHVTHDVLKPLKQTTPKQTITDESCTTRRGKGHTPAGNAMIAQAIVSCAFARATNHSQALTYTSYDFYTLTVPVFLWLPG